MASNPCPKENLHNYHVLACQPGEAEATNPKAVEFGDNEVRKARLSHVAQLSLVLGVAFLFAGCPKQRGASEKSAERQGPRDPDAAVDFYLKATKSHPQNVKYRLKLDQTRFEAGKQHVENGMKQREQGELLAALSEFQRAKLLDPSSVVADHELKNTVNLLVERARIAQAAEWATEDGQSIYASQPPQLKPLSRAPLNLKMANDAKVIFDTLGKLAGLTVIYDPDLQARRISTELNDVTLEQALDIICLESKTFWKPITENIVIIVPDQTQKRRDYEEQEIRTFYLNNVAAAQDLTEVTTGLRQLLDLKRIQQVNTQNALIVRDTPDKLAMVEKVIRDIDKARPEVMIQMEVLQARADKLRDLGIQLGQRASITINPNYGSSSSSSSSKNTASLEQLTHLNQNDVVLTLPDATANFLLTDSTTKIIDNPEIRAVDGQPAKLRVGDRVPVATGSFQAGTGAGSAGVNPLVNTQFQYIDVGVSLDVTPYVHVNREISMKVLVEVSSVTGYATIGGIQQPIISQRKIEHEIRLKEGEVSILGGLFERVDTKTLNGWPGLANVPIMRYLFSSDDREQQENENLIVIIPHILRMPDWSLANLRAMYSGTETYPSAKKIKDLQSPLPNPSPQAMAPAAQSPSSSAEAAPMRQLQANGSRIRFEPAKATLNLGQTATIDLVAENVRDLCAVPLLIKYDPSVISIEEVRRESFLSGGTQEIALVQRIDKKQGQAIVSASRQPDGAGVSGTGVLLSFVIRGIGAGSSELTIVQVNATDSQKKQIPVQTGGALLQVKN